MNSQIWIYDEIGPSEWGLIDSRVVRDALGEIEGDVDVHVNSPGGDATEGIAIGQAFARHDGKVRMVVDSLAASAATLLLPGVDSVEMAPHAHFVTHDPWTITVGNQGDHQMSSAMLGKMRDTIVNIYSERVGDKVSRARLRDMLDQDEVWLTAAEAVEMGFADGISGNRQETPLAANLGRFRDRFKNIPKDVLGDAPKSDERRELAAKKLRSAHHSIVRHKIDLQRQNC